MELNYSKIKVNRHEVIGAWKCCQQIIKLEIPANPADVALIMECMTSLSNQYREKTNKEYKIRLEEKMLKPIWHCLNIFLSNNMAKNHTEATVLIQMLEKIAYEIDGDKSDEAKMNQPILELIK